MGNVGGLFSHARLWGGVGLFALDFIGGLVFAKALEGCLAEEVVGGPRGEVDLGYEVGLDPEGAATGVGWWLIKWCGGLAQRIELIAKDMVSLLRKAGASAARVDEFSGRFP